MPNFYVPESFRAPLLQLATMSDEDMESLRQTLESVAPSLAPVGLIAQAQDAIKKNVPGLPDIIKTLLSLSNARENSNIPVDLLVADVTSQVPNSIERKTVDSALLGRRLSALLSLPPLLLSAKAFDVQHEYERLFLSARIMSDVRTVFDQAGTEVVATMIVHNLVIKYSQDREFREISIALDDADIVRLRQVLDRAEVKTTALEKMIDKTGIRYLESKKRE